MKKIAGNSHIQKKNTLINLDLVPLDELIKNYETPLHIFLKKKIEDNISTFNNIFKDEFDGFECFYSLKANFLPEICKIVNSTGVGANVVGIPGLKLALEVGFSPNSIIVGGPYLPKDLLELSIKSKVKEIIVYSLDDIKKINDIAKKHHIVQNICIRVNSQKYGSKLGVKFNKNNLKILKQSIKSYNHIKVSTLLSHFATQMNNINQFDKNIKNLVSNLKILLEHEIYVENINLGGGFPEATVMPHNQLAKIAQIIKTNVDDLNIKGIYLEPGRYFVGDSGLFLTKIVKVGEDRWIFLNIGNHICPKFAKCSLRFYNASQINNPHKYKTNIAGIVPSDQDVLAKNYFFTQNLTTNDYVIVTNTGAYCLTFSNRFPYKLPTIILIDGNSIKEIFDPKRDHDFSIS